MKLSVLINNYNYGRYLGECIDSVLAQDYPSLEVIVVDDGSTDESREIIAGYGTRVVPVLKENGGQASSFNAGFAVAAGEVILLLDADDAFLPGKPWRVAETFAGRDIDWCFDRVTTDSTAIVPQAINLSPFDGRAASLRGKFPSIPVPTSGLSFRHSLLAKILPMPVAADVVLSDNYLKFAAAALGKGVIVETPLTFQRIHDANRYTGTGAATTLRPRIMIETGLQLATRFPTLAPMGVRLVAGGLSDRELGWSATAEVMRRCAQPSAFGPIGAMKIAARLLAKKLLQRGPRLRPAVIER
jgi:hypothetical protein